MDVNKLLSDLSGCTCGREHKCDTEIVEIGSGLVHKVGEILTNAGFPKKILAVADCNTVKVSNGIFESLENAGFTVKKLIYSDMKYARIEQLREIEALCSDVEGIISIGTGSLNDLCRVSSFEKKLDFCIFATAPSMDGFASDTAPIVENNFKTSWFVAQPRIIIADTAILAKAPVELKAAGFGDMVAKYLGILEWKLANILIDEYYCDCIANLTLSAVSKMVALADKVTAEDEETAGAIMEALVMSGIAMKLAGCSRPASGSEHVLSHYLECYKLARGIWPEFHGKKVGVATLILNRVYRNVAERVETIEPTADKTDWDKVYAAFDASQVEEVRKLNNPTITDKVDPERLKKAWPEIRQMIFDMLPENDELLEMMKAAGCAVTTEEIHVSPELLENGLRYHNYMRYRLLLPRLFPMMGIDIMDFVD